MRIIDMQCTFCGEVMEYEVVEITLDARQAIGQPGWYCWTCNLSGHTAQDLFLAEHLLTEHQAEDSPVTPAGGQE